VICVAQEILTFSLERFNLKTHSISIIPGHESVTYQKFFCDPQVEKPWHTTMPSNVALHPEECMC